MSVLAARISNISPSSSWAYIGSICLVNSFINQNSWIYDTGMSYFDISLSYSTVSFAAVIIS